MSEAVVFFFLAASILAYTVTGGADFGVGIVERFAPKKERDELRRLAEKAIAPIWEANHMWIVLALVITFVAYPHLHVAITTSLHVPLLIMLVGIILRGTAFTFRYYDTADDPLSRGLWTVLFRGGSLLVPFMFGIIATALQRGTVSQSVNARTVWELYFAPWLGWLPLFAGIFVVCLFAWLAVAFLLGEVPREQRPRWGARLRRWTTALMLSGLAVTLAAWMEAMPLLDNGLFTLTRVFFVGVASLAMALLYSGRLLHQIWLARAFVGLVVTCILAGYFGAAYPVAMRFTQGEVLSFADAQAPPATLDAMALVLVLSSIVVLPALAYLYKIFKSQSES